ncbi:hypothetical protein [Butyrivibrio proteoclasticus]|uniref:hypothetical protein n=1 Tax=Butyrivibrio proteoclasticus TaxID=43305 RepID=UPI000688DB56|nr:hypothetical protein [Butyrivibrio proteoclasticus]
MILKWSMYYLSFTPLWCSILFVEAMSLLRGSESTTVEWITIIGVPILFIISMRIFRAETKPHLVGSTMVYLRNATEEKLSSAEFLATYIMPLLAFDFTRWEGMALFGFFFLVFGKICLYHNYLCTNIVLDILKYRVYDCTLEDNNHIIFHQKIISKEELRTYNDQIVYIRKLNNDYSFSFKVQDDIGI